MSALSNRCYLAMAAPARLRFERAVRDPEQAQLRILKGILRANAGSEFGRRHGFDEITTVQAWREGVPLRDYDAYRPFIDRIVGGASNVLTAEPVRLVEPTGGSSGIAKLIPYTARLTREFAAATLPWVFDLLVSRNRTRNGRAYWAISPPLGKGAHTPGGLSIGMDHDSDYFPPAVRRLLDRSLGIPRAVSRLFDMHNWRYVTLRSLLAMEDLALISVWHPSFLTLLAAEFDERFDALLEDLASGRLSLDLEPGIRTLLEAALPARPALAARLRRRFGRTPPADLGELWTQLDLISCWTDGHAAQALTGMQRRFPRVEVQGKGLLATEGVVSFPLLRVSHPVAAVSSHFIEFLPTAGGGQPLMVHELQPGQTYEVVLTTGGGLYRYRLQDLVRVEGRFHRTPLLRFVGRADGTSDLAGEKLTPALAERVINSACRQLGVQPRFAMLAPSRGDVPAYVLLAETDEPNQARLLASHVETLLSEAHHYRLCRELRQLGPVRGVPVRDAERIYARVCSQRGQRAAAIKTPGLDGRLDWERMFTSTTEVVHECPRS